MHLFIHLTLGKGKWNILSAILTLSQISSPHFWLRKMPRINMCYYRLNNNNGRIHYHSKVDSSERHQIAINTESLHHTEGKEHTERNHAGNHQTCTPITQKDNQHKDNNESTLNKVSGDGTLYSIHQVGTVNERLYHNAFRQRFMNLLNALLHIPTYFLEVFTLQHDGNTSYDFTFSIAGNSTKPGSMPQLNLSYIAHLNRCTANCLHRDIGNILQTLDGSDSSDIILVGIFFDIASTGIGIVLFQRIKHFANGNIVGIQLVSIHCHLILLHITAPTTHFSYTGSS